MKSSGFERFVNVQFNTNATPLDYLALLRDQYFLNLIEHRAATLRLDIAPTYDTASASSSTLLASLDAELGRVRE